MTTAIGIRRSFDRAELGWALLGGLLAALFFAFAYRHLTNLHFRAWQVNASFDSTDGLARALRPAVTGWLAVVVMILGLVAGAVTGLAAVGGRVRLYLGLIVSVVVLLVAIEIFQGAGQDERLVDEVDNVPISGLVLGLLLLATAIGWTAVGTRALNRSD